MRREFEQLLEDLDDPVTENYLLTSVKMKQSFREVIPEFLEFDPALPPEENIYNREEILNPELGHRVRTYLGIAELPADTSLDVVKLTSPAQKKWTTREQATVNGGLNRLMRRGIDTLEALQATSLVTIAGTNRMMPRQAVFFRHTFRRTGH